MKNGGHYLKVNALLDDASSKSYISSGVASSLGLQGEHRKLNVTVLNGEVARIDSMTVEVELSSTNGQVNRKLKVDTVERVTGDTVVTDWRSDAAQWPHLKDIPFPQLGYSKGIDMIIGLDQSDLHVSQCDISGLQGEPAARLTPLGWTCISAP